ncbi:MAG TPA: phosphoribosyltransferase family protein [Gemmatimonadales bacterium]|nr:phosphoribosyltransferase family protein [Gemmatimonadales bacterium]
MLTRFRDRREAGRHLADALRNSIQGEDLQVLALPRGGVPVGYEVAVALGAPLDVFLVRKLGLPGQEELAMGAIAEGGVRVLNQEVVQMLRIPQRTIEEVAAAERAELARRERLYRGDHPPPDLRNRTVLLVDDGLATGSTMAAAVAGVRTQHPRRIIVAVPVASPQALAALRRVADDCVAVLVPRSFGGVGQWYEDFRQTTDAEVLALLSALRPRAPAPGTA